MEILQHIEGERYERFFKVESLGETELPPCVNVIFTNPDMLHLAINPFHAKWEGFFKILSMLLWMRYTPTAGCLVLILPMY